VKYPNFKEEKILWQQGFKLVAGLDEAGRGPLAGPVVAATAVIIKSKIKKEPLDSARCNSAELIQKSKLFAGIRDSKKLSEEKREFFYRILINHPQIEWGIGIVSEKVIDKINILEATKLAMQKAVADLGVTPEFLILDGNFKIKSNIPQKSIIAGDQKVISIVMASIIAKVTRDRIMKKFHKKYPQYRFDKHKGYGTALHLEMLGKFGPCRIHRKSFYPISAI